MPAKGAWQSYEHYRQTAENQKKYGRSADAVNFLFGGPVGWGKIATGEQGLGGNFGEHRADFGLTEEDYNAMTDEEHNAYENMNQNQRAVFLAKMRERNKANADAQAKADAEQAERDKKEAAFQQWREGNMHKLEQFSNEMGMSVEELLQRGDYGIKRVGQQAVGAAGRSAYAAGLGGGGVSSMNTQRAMADAHLGYQMQRAQLGAQARNQLLDQMSGMAHEQEDMRRYEQGMNLQLQQAEQAAQQQAYQQKLAASGQTLGMIGGVVGAYFGGPAGAQAGYQLGSGLGQQRYANSNPYTPYQYKYPGSTNKSYGLGTGGGRYNPTTYGGQ